MYIACIHEFTPVCLGFPRASLLRKQVGACATTVKGTSDPTAGYWHHPLAVANHRPKGTLGRTNVQHVLVVFVDASPLFPERFDVFQKQTLTTVVNI